MKNLGELISPDPAWPLVKKWANESNRHVQLLPCAGDDGEKTLLALQVSTHSTLGSMALHCGGLLIDHGWLRLLGAGHPRIVGNLRSWNRLDGEVLDGVERIPGALVVGYDVLGGIFAVNGGGIEGEMGHVSYFAPDQLEWESTDLGYSAFVNWAFSDQVAGFYGEDRWPNFAEDLKSLATERAYTFQPPIWMRVDDVRTRKEAPLTEVVSTLFAARAQLMTTSKEKQ